MVTLFPPNFITRSEYRCLSPRVASAGAFLAQWTRTCYTRCVTYDSPVGQESFCLIQWTTFITVYITAYITASWNTVFLLSQSCFSSSDYTAVDSALCFVTLRRHCLSLPDFDERLVPPVSSVLLHCSLSVSSLSRRARSGVETGFVLLRGGPDRNRFRNLRSRLPDGFSGASGSGAAGVDTGFAPLWAKPGRNRFRFRRPSLPTNLPRRRGQVHGYCLNSGPILGANFVARILLIIKCFWWFLATGFWTRVMLTSKGCKIANNLFIENNSFLQEAIK